MKSRRMRREGCLAAKATNTQSSEPPSLTERSPVHLNRERLRLVRGADLQASVLEHSQGKDLPEMRKNLQRPYVSLRQMPCFQ